jgi:hypothetical protein
MGRKQFIINLKSVLILLGFVPILVTGQNYPRFELYQLKQGTDSGQFIVTGLDSNLAFNNILRFRSADSTFLIGTDTVITDQSIIPILLRTIDAGLGIDVNQLDNQIFIESLSIEDSIYNGTASLISKGTPLYATGVQGNYWSVAPADASDPSKMPVVVIAGEDISNGETGLGLIKGHIKQVNTTGLADGAEVYVASGGGYTSTKPTAEGVIIQRLGTVIKGNSTNGSGIINLGDEAYWNDFTSLSKLRDTLAVFRDSITNQIGDSLINYVDRVELGDSLTLFLKTEVDGDITNELQTLSYNTLTDVISISSGNSIDISEVNQNQTITLSGDVTGSGTTSITATVVDDSHNHIISNVDGLQAELDSKLESEVDGSVTNEGSLTVEAGSASTSVISSNTSGSTDVTLTAGTNITLSESGNNITIAASGGGVTTTNWGNNKVPTFSTETNIDGDNGFWINGFYELVDNLTDGVAPNSTGYQLKLSHTAFIDSIETNHLDLNSNLTLANNLIVQGSSTFEGSVGDSYFNGGGQLGVQTTPSGNLSLTTRYGATFNTDNNLNYGDVTMNGYLINNLFNLDASEDAIAIGGSTPNSNFDLKTYRGVYINESQSGGIYDGLLVSGSSAVNLLNVKANLNKVGINELTPAYTLDVDGDINFTGDLYDNGSLVSFGGTTINNNADNRIITGSNTANTLNGESSLLFDGEDLELQSTTTNAILRLQNSNSGYTTSDGFAISSTSGSVYVNNKELGDIWFYTDNDFTKMIILRANGTVDLTHYAGSGNQELGVDNSGEIIFYSASDGRHKKRITSNIQGIEAVMKLKPLEYQWNKDVPNYDGHNEIGFIAQEVKEAIPLAVPYEEKDVKILGYKHRAITATLTKAIQEQQEIIQSIQTDLEVKNIQIQLQDQRIQQLEEMVKKLIENK